VNQLVVVGLGNPGKAYAKTRHNIGFLVLDAFAKSRAVALKENARFSAATGKSLIENAAVHLVKPTTYMNKSGLAVRKYLSYFNLPPEQLLVVADDYALPFGQFRLRQKGSCGGHNGLRDIELELGTQNYPRLKIGIRGEHAPKGNGEGDLANYVLNPFSAKEQEALPLILEKGVKVIEQLTAHEFHEVMNAFNKKTENPPKKTEERTGE